MREIKFRAWSILNAKMLSWADIFHLPAWEIFPGTPEQRAFIVMQYTGLKDKNDKEIYEGDIVHFKTLRGKEYIGEVKSYEDAASFFVVAKEHYMECLDDVYELKVLGNIYENKELLDE